MNRFEQMLAANRQKWNRHTDPTVPLHYDYPALPLKHFFIHWANKHPQKPYLISAKGTISYSGANDIACRLANALLSLGVHKGERVATIMAAIPESVLSFQALLKIGGIEVPFNDRSTSADLCQRFADSQAETAIAHACVLPKLLPLLDAPNYPLKRIICVDASTDNPLLDDSRHIYSYEKLIAGSASAEPEIIVTPQDVVRLQYTGGTTGVYKGCVLTNHMILVQAILTAMWYTSGYTVVDQDLIRTLCAIPLSHIYGFNANINICLFTGGTIILSNSAKPQDILYWIQKERPTLFAVVPKLLVNLLDNPDIEKADLSSLRGIFCGSAPLPLNIIERFERLTGGVIAEGYGMSEATCTITVNPLCSTRKVGSVGIARPDTDLLIVDSLNGQEVMETNQLGEIIVRGSTIINEYWQNPAETKNAIHNGWLFTGDIGKLDEDGYLFITGRKKDVINCSGLKVYPREVEEALYAIPQVLDACVLGIPDPKRGETVKACIVLKKGEELTATQIMDCCKQSLMHYKVPTVVEFMASMPQTAAGKVDRKKLLEMSR